MTDRKVPELPCLMTCNVQWRGYQAGDTYLLKTPAELKSAMVYADAGILTVEGYEAKRPAAAPTAKRRKKRSKHAPPDTAAEAAPINTEPDAP